MIGRLLVHRNRAVRWAGVGGMWIVVFVSLLGLTLGTVEAVGSTIEQRPAVATQQR